LLFALLLSGALLRALPPTAEDVVVENYIAASQEQERVLRGASMEVDIEASLPKLKKHGRLHALRRISTLGRITYDHLRFEGDKTIKNDVIARYLSAESQAQSGGAASMAVTPANYKFKYEGLFECGGQTVQVFHVTPRHKQVGLFKGEIWIDAQTYLPVRESGRLVKNPSLFLKRVEFVKEYDIRDGVSVPRQLHSLVYTRLVGPAEITVDYANVSLPEMPRQASLVDVGDQ
jgi:hypothetical protein